MRARVVLIVLVALIVAVPILASARLSQLDDPDDTKGLLDISRVKVEGTQGPRWSIITFSRWTTTRIWDRGFALVHIDARGDGHFEHYALIRSVGPGLVADLYRDRRSRPDYRVGRLTVWRNNDRSLTVRIPLAKLGMPVTRAYYRWFAKTLMTGRDCPRVCIDRAPDTGSVDEVLVEPEPSPTVTVEPSPSVTAEPSPEPSASPSP